MITPRWFLCLQLQLVPNQTPAATYLLKPSHSPVEKEVIIHHPLCLQLVLCHFRIAYKQIRKGVSTFKNKGSAWTEVHSHQAKARSESIKRQAQLIKLVELGMASAWFYNITWQKISEITKIVLLFQYFWRLLYCRLLLKPCLKSPLLRQNLNILPEPFTASLFYFLIIWSQSKEFSFRSYDFSALLGGSKVHLIVCLEIC